MTWNRFHSKYLQSPYLSTDTLSLACYFDNSTSHEASTVQQGQDNSTDFPSTTDQGTDQKESELPKRKVSQHVHVYYVHLYMQIMCLLSNHVNYLYSLSSLPPSLSLSLSPQTYMTSLKQHGEHVRTNLKVLETLTYTCTNPDQLDQLASKLDSLIKDFRIALPKSEGLILQPQARLAARKRAKIVKYKYLNLTLRLKRGLTRSDWRYRNRVGQRAESFRIHVYNMYMCI